MWSFDSFECIGNPLEHSREVASIVHARVTDTLANESNKHIIDAGSRFNVTRVLMGETFCCVKGGIFCKGNRN